MPDDNLRAGIARIALVQGDITRERVDAIVNAANTRLRGGGGVDGAIHRAAGPALLDELVARYPDGSATGDVRATGGHGLPVKAILHAVGPVYRDGRSGEAELLARCHRKALALAEELRCVTVAFPAISCGVYGYPVRLAAPIALRTVGEELARRPALTQVRFVLLAADVLAEFTATLAVMRG